MSFTLKQALKFNKFTTALSAGGVAYASAIAGESEGASPTVKLLGTGAILFFAVSVLFGALVLGRASRLPNKEDEYIDDEQMKLLGQVHSLTLVLGLLFSSVLMINKIWRLL
jgi:hypothetical protein